MKIRPLSFAPLLGPLFLVVLSLAMAVCKGGYYRVGLERVTIGLVLFVIAQCGLRRVELSTLAWERILTACAAIFLNSLAQHPGLLYVTNVAMLQTMKGLLYVALAGTLMLLASLFNIPVLKRVGSFRSSVVWGLLGLLAVVHVLVLWAAPTPHIDVFTIGTAAADRFLHGLNPYGTVYTEIYGGQFGYTPVFNYPPAVLYGISAARALAGDIRVLYLIAEVVSVGAITLLAKSFGLSRAIGLLLALVWYALPTGIFVLEQAWVDPLLVTFTLLSCLALRQHKYTRLGILLGLHFATKQYGILFSGLMLGWLALRGEWKVVARTAAVASVTVFVLMGPFLWTDATAFIQNNVWDLLAQSVRLDAFTWTAFFGNVYGEIPPRWVQIGAPAAALAAVVAFWVAVRRGWGEWLTGLILFHAVVFLFAKQAFCNYYYYLSIFILMAILVRMAPNEETAC